VSEKNPLPENWLRNAVAWLNWFGLQKIRFFGLESYLKFLQDQAIKLQKDLKDTRQISDNICKLGLAPWKESIVFKVVNSTTIINWMRNGIEPPPGSPNYKQQWGKARELEWT
jgi:hypothetical protein